MPQARACTTTSDRITVSSVPAISSNTKGEVFTTRRHPPP